MVVSIVVHSNSGVTAKLAKRVDTILRDAGHEVSVELLRAKGKVKPHDKNVELRNVPDVSKSDVVIVGAPVWAFTLSPVMEAYLKKLTPMKDKKFYPVVSHSIPFKSGGAKQAIGRIKELLDIVLADVDEGETMFSFFWGTEKRLNIAAQKLADKILGLPLNS